MEIELRAKVNNQSLLEKKLNELSGIKEKKTNERQVDIYLKHKEDKERKMIIRLRKNYKNNNAILTFKGSAPNNKEDIAWEDYDTPIKNPDKLERLLINNGYVYVCLVDKVRQSFLYKDYEINIDNIRDLGVFIEIEKKGEEENIDQIKNEILNLLIKLGIKENEIINKGYVQLVIELNK